MRVRTRTIESPIMSPQPRYEAYDGSWSYPYSSPQFMRLRMRQEYMEDTGGGNGKRVVSTPCLHKSSSGTSLGTEVSVLYKGGSNPSSWYYTTATSVVGCSMVSGAPTVEISISTEKAFQDMITGVLSDAVLSPVFLKELPKMKQTFRDLTERKFGAKKFANKYLAYKFGILPFISDLKKMVSYTDKIRQHAEFLSKRYGTTVKVRRTVGQISGEVSYLRYSDRLNYTVEHVPWMGSAYSGGRIRVMRQYDAQDKINAYCDLYGSNLLAVGWELIPYSFVVDWFVDFGDILSSLWPKAQRPVAMPLDIWSCVKASVNVPVHTWCDKRQASVAVQTSSWKYFSRTASPPVASSLLGDGLTWARAPVAGALAIQKIAK